MTGCLLGGVCPGGVSAGRVSVQGGVCPEGVSVHEGVSAQGGVCSVSTRVCLSDTSPREQNHRQV